MPPDGVSFALAALFVGGGAYAEWVAWPLRRGTATVARRTRLEALTLHAAALIQVAIASLLIIAS